MAAASVTAANRKKDAGPSARPNQAASSTDTGATPKLVSSSSPFSRPRLPCGAQRWNAVIVQVLPNPLHTPVTACAVITQPTLPSNGRTAIARASARNAEEPATAGRCDDPAWPAARVPSSAPAANPARIAP
jgi:hypothetical protein